MKFFLTILSFFFAGTAFLPESAIGSGCLQLNIQSANLRLPLGFSANELAQAIEIFISQERYRPYGAMVFYGSRMSHSVGLKPKADGSSDLDVTFFPIKDIPQDERLNFMLESKEDFETIAKEMGFHVSEEIPTFDSFETASKTGVHGRLNSLTKEQEKKIWDDLIKSAERDSKSREQIKMEFVMQLKGGLVKDALFVVKGARAKEHAAFLKSHHYHNLFIVPHQP